MTASGIMDFIKDHERRLFAAHLGTVWQLRRNRLRHAESSGMHLLDRPHRRSPDGALRLGSAIAQSTDLRLSRYWPGANDALRLDPARPWVRREAERVRDLRLAAE